jgi:hypothetical protein
LQILYRSKQRSSGERKPAQNNEAPAKKNYCVHSITKFKPADLFFAATSAISLEEIIKEKNYLFKMIQEKIKEKQVKDLSKNKANFNFFDPDQKKIVKNKQIKAKTKGKYFEKVVAEDQNTKVKTKSGKIVHKSNIRN